MFFARIFMHPSIDVRSISGVYLSYAEMFRTGGPETQSASPAFEIRWVCMRFGHAIHDFPTVWIGPVETAGIFFLIACVGESRVCALD